MHGVVGRRQTVNKVSTHLLSKANHGHAKHPATGAGCWTTTGQTRRVSQAYTNTYRCGTKVTSFFVSKSVKITRTGYPFQHKLPFLFMTMGRAGATHLAIKIQAGAAERKAGGEPKLLPTASVRPSSRLTSADAPTKNIPHRGAGRRQNIRRNAGRVPRESSSRTHLTVSASRSSAPSSDMSSTVFAYRDGWMMATAAKGGGGRGEERG